MSLRSIGEIKILIHEINKKQEAVHENISELEINQLKISNLNNINIKYSEIYVIEVLWKRRTRMSRKLFGNILQPQTHKSEEKTSNYRSTYFKKITSLQNCGYQK